MITFVVYSKTRKECDLYSGVIERFLFSRKDHYEIMAFDEYCTDMMEQVGKLGGVKIFILDVDVPTASGIELARKIRINGDFMSPIILLSDGTSIDESYNNILYLSILYKSKSIAKDLLLSLRDAYLIATRYSVLSFSYFDELYRLPYDDICYIEKDLNCNSVTIYTLDDTYQNYISIKELQARLRGDPRFYKSHRSCIINIYNVASYDRKNNMVIFKNGMTTNLISRSKKNLLVKRIEEVSKLEDVK